MANKTRRSVQASTSTSNNALPKADTKPRTDTSASTDPEKHNVGRMHPDNPHQHGYDMTLLCQAWPALAAFLYQTPRQQLSINFADPAAVKCLNQALMALHYGYDGWDVPAGNLCPAIPGRLDYLLYLRDLLTLQHQARPLKGVRMRSTAIRALDIGCGANLVYPLLGYKALGWRFVAAEADSQAFAYASAMAQRLAVSSAIEVRWQPKPRQIFQGIMQSNELFDVTLCNPPFHDSAEAAAAGSARKRQQLGLAPTAAALNFAGQDHELWCPGGELAFIGQMIKESSVFANQVAWFSSLVSQSANVAPLQQLAKQQGATQIEVIAMAQGHKQSRLLAWSFLTPAQWDLWRQHRWRV